MGIVIVAPIRADLIWAYIMVMSQGMFQFISPATYRHAIRAVGTNGSQNKLCMGNSVHLHMVIETLPLLAGNRRDAVKSVTHVSSDFAINCR